MGVVTGPHIEGFHMHGVPVQGWTLVSSVYGCGRLT